MIQWEDQIRLCESLVPADRHFSENQKKLVLKNVVASVVSLSTAKDQSDQHFSRSGQELTHEKYSKLLFSAATTYDAQVSSLLSQSSRKICVTEADYSYFSRDSISEVKEKIQTATLMHPLTIS